MKPLILLLCAAALSECSASTINVVAPSAAVNIGDTFTVDVVANAVADLYAFQLDLTYNPLLLSAVSVTEGSFLPAAGSTIFIPGTIDAAGGDIAGTADTLTGAVSGVNGDGILTSFQFTALAAGSSGLLLQNLILLDSSLGDITGSASITQGSVTVGAASSPVPEPSMLFCMALGLFVFSVPLFRRMKSQR